jgi:aminopeptidase N
MAHQWFGDLVTMQWWDDVWLNEGFATWMTSKPLAAWKPEWNIWPNQGPLSVDALKSTRPIHARGDEANTPAQIGTLFDGIAYGKAASVLRMLESWLGEETFRKGVNLYLQQHAYGNARSADFWNAMAKASGKPVDKVMPTWVEQAGAPMVSVKAQCSGNQTTVDLSQTRFFNDPELLKAGSPEVWQIPVCIKTAGAQAPRCELMTLKQQSVKLSGCSPWVFVNAGGRGYYWSAYSPELTGKLAEVAEQALTPPERVSLLNDEWAQVRAGQHPIAQYLDLAQAMRSDHTRQVVQQIAGRVAFISDYLAEGPDQDAFRDSDDVRSTRGTVIDALGFAGRDPEVLRRASELAQQYMKDPASVDPNVGGIAVELAPLTGDAKLYDAYEQHMNDARTPHERNTYMEALTRFPQADLAQRTLAMTLSPEIKSQDMFRGIDGLLANPETRDLAWAFFKSHWPEIEKKVGAGLGFGFGGLAGVFCSEASKQDAQHWFAQHPDPGGPRELHQGIEQIDTCVRVRNTQGPNLASWLKQHAGAATQ